MAQADYVTNAIRALMTGAGAEPSTNPVRAAHAEFVAALVGHPPWPISLDPDATDLEDRADHVNKVLNALSVYVTAILDDTAQNVPGGLDLRNIDALLSDLASDVTAPSSVPPTPWQGGSHESAVQTCRPPPLHRWLGRPDHHGQ
jgi:hypothetical protein